LIRLPTCHRERIEHRVVDALNDIPVAIREVLLEIRIRKNRSAPAVNVDVCLKERFFAERLEVVVVSAPEIIALTIPGKERNFSEYRFAVLLIDE